jgi:hypothetical protein
VGVRAGIRIAGLLALAVIAAPLGARAGTPDQAKAAFLYKLAPFVDWPATLFPTPVSPFTICIVGADPFGPVLDQTVGRRLISHHPIVVRRLEAIDADSGCNVAYLAGSKAQSIQDALDEVEGTPVLTVTDAAVGETRGAVHLLLVNRRVRFVIDEDAAARNGLTISSKLMQLALAVRRKEG